MSDAWWHKIQTVQIKKKGGVARIPGGVASIDCNGRELLSENVTQRWSERKGKCFEMIGEFLVFIVRQEMEGLKKKMKDKPHHIVNQRHNVTKSIKSGPCSPIVSIALCKSRPTCVKRSLSPLVRVQMSCAGAHHEQDHEAGKLGLLGSLALLF